MWQVQFTGLVLLVSLLKAEAFPPLQSRPNSCGSITSKQYRLRSPRLKIKNGNSGIRFRRSYGFRNRLTSWKRTTKDVFVQISSAAAESTMNVDDDEIEARTLTWIRKSVIGLNLCPFAERPMKQKELYINVVRGDDDSDVGKAVTAALHFTANESPGVTTIVVAPDYSPDDFERYLGMVQFLEQVVMDRDEIKLSDLVQIAPFHPLFQLDDGNTEGEKDPIGVYTNRGPYPMFHVIRADDVAEAVDKLDGDPGKVCRRNQRLLKNMEEKMGRKATVGIVMGMDDEEEDPSQISILNSAIKQTSIEMQREEEDGGRESVERGNWDR